jgi:beta-phosphoglucomutase-like phosphatase (HAD superfamily)
MDEVRVTEKSVLLDFDGTICHLFARHDMSSTRASLLSLVNAAGLEAPKDLDPFDYWSWIGAQVHGAQAARLFEEVGRIVVHAELEAVESADLIPGVEDFIDGLVEGGTPFAVVTNNSSLVVQRFAQMRMPKLRDVPVVGRDALRPDLMKPSPHSITKALALLGRGPDEAYLIGDSISDLEAATAAGCEFVAMGSTPDKYRRLASRWPSEGIVRDFDELTNRWRRGAIQAASR